MVESQGEHHRRKMEDERYETLERVRSVYRAMERRINEISIATEDTTRTGGLDF